MLSEEEKEKSRILIDKINENIEKLMLKMAYGSKN